MRRFGRGCLLPAGCTSLPHIAKQINAKRRCRQRGKWPRFCLTLPASHRASTFACPSEKPDLASCPLLIHFHPSVTLNNLRSFPPLFALFAVPIFTANNFPVGAHQICALPHLSVTIHLPNGQTDVRHPNWDKHRKSKCLFIGCQKATARLVRGFAFSRLYCPNEMTTGPFAQMKPNRESLASKF